MAQGLRQRPALGAGDLAYCRLVRQLLHSFKKTLSTQKYLAV